MHSFSGESRPTVTLTHFSLEHDAVPLVTTGWCCSADHSALVEVLFSLEMQSGRVLSALKDSSDPAVYCTQEKVLAQVRSK